ncbi:MAG: hypothetical protein OEV91_10470 [Desulfobulbaceae bacterium]|nr:hypothetical protein [Desulfobulbaceae bacterium]
MKKSCSLNDFMQELTPWLDTDHIKSARLDGYGHLVLLFRDNMQHVYDITDCNRGQVEAVLADLKAKGIVVEA